MTDNEKLVSALNQLLSDELTAICQYMVHSEMCDNWGYDKLHKAIEHQAIEEMHHAEWLIRRILFLGGIPVVSNLNSMNIGKTVFEMIFNDEAAERTAVKAYNAAVDLAVEINDQATADLLGRILTMEEAHMDWGEIQRVQIGQMGLENYLSNQTA
jgi:bacterioferritin